MVNDLKSALRDVRFYLLLEFTSGAICTRREIRRTPQRGQRIIELIMV
jgi:hypothetical protein